MAPPGTLSTNAATVRFDAGPIETHEPDHGGAGLRTIIALGEAARCTWARSSTRSTHLSNGSTTQHTSRQLITLFCVARGTSTLAAVARARLRAERGVRTPYSCADRSRTPRIDAAEVLQATEQLGGVCRYNSISAAYVGANRPPLERRRRRPDGLGARPRVRRQVRGDARRARYSGDCRYACTGSGACGVYASTRKTSASDERDPARIVARPSLSACDGVSSRSARSMNV
jgi:hypothetical protein